MKLPDVLTTIGDDAFSSCSSFTAVTIPAGVTSIGTGAFSSCSKLGSIVVEAGNTAYCSVDGVLFSKDGTVLLAYPGGKADGSYAIPEGVTTIAEYAFQGCDTAVEIVVPASVTTVDRWAFSFSDVTDVIFVGNAPTIGNYAFSSTTATIYYPAGNNTWVNVANKNYQGTLTWIALTEPMVTAA